MKAKFLTFIVLVAFVSGAFFLQSCGKKDETTTTTQDTNKTQQQQQSITQQQTQTETKQQEVKKDSVKADDKKKEDEKKKEEEKKKKEEEEKKKKEEEVKKEQTSVNTVDFAPVWSKKCAKCHGKDGKGKLEGVPDLTSGETKSKSTNQLKQIIENGKKGKTDDDEDMPSFKGKITDEEIDAAAKYVKGL